MTQEQYDQICESFDRLKEKGWISDFDHEERIHALNKMYVEGLSKANKRIAETQEKARLVASYGNDVTKFLEGQLNG